MSRLFGFVFAACLLAFATSISVLAANPDWPKSLTLATASPGGVFYVYGEAVAKNSDRKPENRCQPFANSGIGAQREARRKRRRAARLLTMGTGLQGWNGTGDWTRGQHYRKMRALFPMYNSPFQFVTLRRSGITTVAQFDNRNVGTGPRAPC